MKHPAQNIGNVGMALAPCNNVHIPYFIMSAFIRVIGHKMFPIVKNIVCVMIMLISIMITSIIIAICNEKPNGAVTIENNCDRYWLCVGGYPRLQRCPAGLAFSIELSKCELDYLVPGWFV